MTECLHALPHLSAVAYGVGGSLTALAVFQAAPAAASALKSSKTVKITRGALFWVGVLIVTFAAAGAVAALIGDPSTPKDGVAWGLGADGLVAGIVRGGGRALRS